MKKLIVLLIFFLFPINSYSKDLATWGVVGTSCQNALDFTKRFGRTGESALSSAIQGFLTGYNTRIMMNNISGKTSVKARVINRLSTKEVTTLILSQCKVRPNDSVYIVLIKYYNTLPFAKY